MTVYASLRIAPPVAALLAATLLAACDSDGDGSGDGASVLSDGSPPVVPLADDTVRALLIDATELGDTLHALAVRLPVEMALPPGACDGGGTRTSGTASASTGGSGIDRGADGSTGAQVSTTVVGVTFTDCALSTNVGLRLDGAATLAESVDGMSEGANTRLLTLDALTFSGDGLSVSATGELSMVVREQGLLLSSVAEAVLDIDDGQGRLMVTGMTGTVPPAPGEGEVSFDYALASTRAGVSTRVTTEQPLGFIESPACPRSGTLAMTLDDGRTVRLTGAPGENVFIDGAIGEDTLACSEIGRLVPASSPSFDPPPSPGG